MERLRVAGLVLALAWITLLTGCYGSHPEDIQAWVKPYETNVTADRYLVQPPDELEIHCAQVPEVHMQRQRVRPDGKISFEVLGEFEVAGRTPEQISTLIGQRIRELYTLPGDHAVDARVAVFASHVYYVLGEVMAPGPRNYTGRDSLMMAVATAGPSPRAWESRVQVIRPSAQEDVDPMIFEANYINMMIYGKAHQDVLLQEGDIVYVPPTILASIGLLLEEFISPIARAFYGYYLVQNPPTQQQGYYPAGGGAYGR